MPRDKGLKSHASASAEREREMVNRHSKKRGKGLVRLDLVTAEV